MIRRPYPRLALPVAIGLSSTVVLVSSCRFEVRLDDPSDASDTGGRLDASVEADAAGDAPEDGASAPDAPDGSPRPCVSGIAVVGSPATAPESAPTLATTGSGPGRRHALLLPPAARASSTLTGLYLFDPEGVARPVEELDLDDGAGGPAQTATIHRRRDEVGFLVLGPTEARLRDAAGAWTSIALPRAPLAPRQREAGWLDDARFAYVGSGTGEPIVVVDTTSSTATVSALDTAGAARVLVGRGAVVISAALPGVTVTEHDAALVETLRLDWPLVPPLGDLLIGATVTGGRRWLVHDGQEFRTQAQLHRVDATGPTFVFGQRVLGPLVTESDDDLVTIVTSDGGLTVFDFTRDAFAVLLTGGAGGLGLVERDEDGYVVVTREPGATGEALVFRCVAL